MRIKEHRHGHARKVKTNYLLTYTHISGFVVKCFADTQFFMIFDSKNGQLVNAWNVKMRDSLHNCLKTLNHCHGVHWKVMPDSDLGLHKPAIAVLPTTKMHLNGTSIHQYLNKIYQTTNWNNSRVCHFKTTHGWMLTKFCKSLLNRCLAGFEQGRQTSGGTAGHEKNLRHHWTSLFCIDGLTAESATVAANGWSGVAFYGGPAFPARNAKI